MSQYEFQRNFAVLIGINEYKNEIPPLETAVHDACELAEILKDYKYDVRLLLDKEASMAGFNQLLAAFKQGEIPFERETVKLGDNDRVLFYFAGHGIAVDALENEEGPAGYLVPSNAQSGNVNSFVLMQELHNALIALPCRHLLIILDCCFAGAFRWSSGKRNAMGLATVYKERYERFIRDRAWQVITSAAHDQKALDFLVDRGQVEQHSPFAAALFQALRGDADMYLRGKDGKPVSDGVITATELYFYLRSKLETATEKLHNRQTPELYQLAKHDKGEYIFLVPGHELNLPPAPPLNRENNPYRGLESFEEVHSVLFFGREQLKQELSDFVCDRQLTVVLGSSGTGKSSLVKAGLIPQLRISQQWCILDPVRPGKSPFAALQSVISQQLSVNSYQSLVSVVTAWCKANPQKKLLLVIDQFEELVTMCQNDEERKQFLSQLESALALPQFHVVLTLRSDFEPQFLTSAFPTRWMDSRFVVRPMTQDDFREVIEKPAAEKVLYFEPVDLIDDLINEVVQMPGALPLLSFTLSELYFKYLKRRGDNRSLTQEDYKELGGVAGSLTQRATQEYENLVQIDPAYKYTIRKVMLRMVTVDGGGLARRRVPLSEFRYPNSQENDRVQQVIQRFTAARLLVSGTEPSGEPYVEPAHDALMRGWNLLQKWRSDKQEIKGLMLRQRLTPAALDWYNLSHEEDYLWSRDPRLVTLEKVLKAPDHENWLNQLETEFVESSLEKREDELEETKKRLRISEERQQIAQARLLAAQAQLVQREDVGLLQSSVLLAVESIKRFNRLETKYLLADQTIRQGLSLLPRPMTRVTRCSNRPYVCSQSFAFCADGNMATATDAIRLLEIPSGREISILEYENDLIIATLSPDGRYAATCGEDSVVKIWLLRNQREVVRFLHHEDVQNIIFSPDSRYIVIISNGFRRVWQLTSSFAVIPVKIPLTTLPAFFSGTGPIAFSPNGNYLAEFVEDSPDSPEGRRLVWELASGRLIIHETVNLSSPSGSEKNLTVWENIDDMAFSLDSQYFVATVTANTVKVWKIPLGEEVMTVENSAWINTIAISANGQYVAAGDRRGEATIWEVPNGYQVAHITDNPTTWLGQVIFSPNGKYLATTGRGFNKITRVYDLPSGREVARMIHENYVLNVIISPDGKYIATQEDSNPEKSYGETVRLWQVVDDFDGKAIVQLDAEKLIDNITISSQGKYLGITYNQGDRFPIYKMDSDGEILSNININHEGIHYAAFSPNEEFVATVSNDNTVRLWEIASGRELPSSIYYEESIIEIAFQDEKHLTTLVNLTSTYIDNMEVLVCDAIVWEIATSTQVKRIENSKVVSMSPDGKYLAFLEDSDSQDKTLLIQEILKDKILRIKLENQELSEFTLSADGKYLAGFGGFYGSDTSVDSDGTMQVWDLSSGDEILPFMKLGRAVTEIVFSPGSRLLAAVVGDTARIWDLLSKQEVTRLEVYGGVNRVIFNWDSQSLISVNYLNQVQLWNLQPEVLIEEACSRLTSNLTEEEWQLYLGDEPYRKTCQNLP